VARSGPRGWQVAHTATARVHPLLANARALVEHALGCQRCHKAMNRRFSDGDSLPARPREFCPIGELLVKSTRALYKALPE